MNPFSFLYLVPIALATRDPGTALDVGAGAAVARGVGDAVLLAPAARCWATRTPSTCAAPARHVGRVRRRRGVHRLLPAAHPPRARRARGASSQPRATSSARQERLASLATLAAGAAHELSTPLSTIAVVAKELERAVEAGASSHVVDDVRLVRDEVERCRAILERMCVDAGEMRGERFAPATVDELVAGALAGLATEVAVRADVDPDARGGEPARAAARRRRGAARRAQERAGRVARGRRRRPDRRVARTARSSSPSRIAARACRPRSWRASASRSSPPSRSGAAWAWACSSRARSSSGSAARCGSTARRPRHDGVVSPCRCRSAAT